MKKSQLKDKPLDTEIIKALTGDDLIEARALYGNRGGFDRRLEIFQAGEKGA